MAAKDIFSRIKKSRLGQAVSNLDRDKEKPGFQFRKSSGQPNFFQRGVQNVRESFREDPGQYSFTRALSNVVPATQIALSPKNYLQGKEPSQFAKDVSYGLRGATQLTPFQAINSLGIDKKGQEQYQKYKPQTQRERQAQSVGRSLYGTVLTSPIGAGSLAQNALRNVSVATGAGAAINTAFDTAGTLLTQRRLPTASEAVKSAGRGAFQGFKQAPLLAVTNPLTSKAVGAVSTGGFTQQQLAQRGISGIANTIEDEILNRVDGLDSNTQNRLLSFAMGAVLTGNNQLWSEFEKQAKSLNVPTRTVKKIKKQARSVKADQIDPQQIQQSRLSDVPVATTEIDNNGKRVVKRLGDFVSSTTQRAKGFVEDQNTLVPVRDKDGNIVRWVKKGEAGFIQIGREKQGTTPETREVDTSGSLRPPKSGQVLREVQPTRGGLRVKETSYDDIISSARKEIGKTQDDTTKNIGDFADNFYKQWVNRFAPIEKLSRQVKGKLKTKQAELRPEYDPEYLIRRFTGAGGIANTKYETELKPIIKQLEQAQIPKDDMDVFLKARRDLGLAQRGIKGSDGDLAVKRLGVLRDQYTGIDSIADQLYRYQNDIFQELIESGFLSKEMGDQIRQQNPDYVPFNRVMDEIENYLGVPSNKLQQGTQPIKKIKGSDRQIYSPIESIIANTFSHRAAIEKNRVAKSIIGLSQVDPELNFNKVPKSGGDTITIWNNGQKEYYQVGKDIADVVKAVDEESMNAVLKIFQAPASILRQGATGRNPDFMIPNVVKDQFDAGVSSKYGYIPFIDYVSGLKSILTNDEMYQRWANSGAKIDLGELSGRKSIEQSFDEATKRKGLLSWIGSGLDVAGKFSEEPTRVGLFKKAYQKTGNELLSVMESRDATVDFARMGSKMKVANSVIPFLNVGIQGFDKIIRTAKNNPGKLALHAGVYGALPAITTTLYNLTNHREEYLEIPQYVKDSNFVFVQGRNEDGTVDYYTVPKGNIIPMIANPVESFLSFLAGNDEQSLAEFANQFISSSLPVVGEGKTLKEIGTKTIGGNLPQLIKPITENLLNRSFYKFDENKQESKEIVPFYLKDKEAYQQAYEWTPETYKAIGAVLNVSPLQVQNLMEGYLAGYTKIPSQIISILNNVSQGQDVRPNDIPILRRFKSATFPTSPREPDIKPPNTPFLQRLTGQAQSSTQKGKAFTAEARDRVKDKLKYGMEVTQNELEQTYLYKPLSMKSGNRYEKSQRDSELWSSISTIENDDKLNPQQKQVLKQKIATELNITPEEVDRYSVAKENNDTKTLYTLDRFDTFQNFDEMMRYLVQGRKPLNGKILVSDGVIDNLVRDGLISEQMGRDLKGLDLNPDGTLKKSKKRGSKSSGRDKATQNYLKALARIKPSSSKFVAPRVASQLNVKNLTLT